MVVPLRNVLSAQSFKSSDQVQRKPNRLCFRMLKAGSRLANIRTRLACQIPNGFELVKTSTVDDLKLDLTEMTHTASGARWIHIDKPSEKQKVFNICFRTVPMTDNGVAHILGNVFG